MEWEEANKIRGSERFLSIIETFPKPHDSLSHAENAGSSPAGTTKELKGSANFG